MTVSRNSAMMSDPYILSQEYERLKMDNDSLVMKIRKLDVENRCLKNVEEEQINQIQDMAMEIFRLKQLVENNNLSLIE